MWHQYFWLLDCVGGKRIPKMVQDVLSHVPVTVHAKSADAFLSVTAAAEKSVLVVDNGPC